MAMRQVWMVVGRECERMLGMPASETNCGEGYQGDSDWKLVRECQAQPYRENIWSTTTQLEQEYSREGAARCETRWQILGQTSITKEFTYEIEEPTEIEERRCRIGSRRRYDRLIFRERLSRVEARSCRATTTAGYEKNDASIAQRHDW